MVCLTQHSDNVQTLINTVHNQAISGTHRMNRKLHSVVVSFAIIFASQLARAAPPVAKIEPFTTDYYGTPVTDDYRWMEVPNSKPLVEFMKGQDDYARSQLNSIPGRAELLKEISAADDIASFTSALVIAGGKYFYCQMAQGQNTAKVYMRDVASGKSPYLSIRVNSDRTARRKRSIFFNLRRMGGTSPMAFLPTALRRPHCVS